MVGTSVQKTGQDNPPTKKSLFQGTSIWKFATLTQHAFKGLFFWKSGSQSLSALPQFPLLLTRGLNTFPTFVPLFFLFVSGRREKKEKYTITNQANGQKVNKPRALRVFISSQDKKFSLGDGWGFIVKRIGGFSGIRFEGCEGKLAQFFSSAFFNPFFFVFHWAATCEERCTVGRGVLFFKSDFCLPVTGACPQLRFNQNIKLTLVRVDLPLPDFFNTLFFAQVVI